MPHSYKLANKYIFMGRWQSGQLQGTVNPSGQPYEGSNPSLPRLHYSLGPLAHLARAPRLHRGGEGFDSPKVHQKISVWN